MRHDAAAMRAAGDTRGCLAQLPDTLRSIYDLGHSQDICEGDFKGYTTARHAVASSCDVRQGDLRE
jgi:hypothetical protein